MDGDTAAEFTTKFSGFIRATFDLSILRKEITICVVSLEIVLSKIIIITLVSCIITLVQNTVGI